MQRLLRWISVVLFILLSVFYVAFGYLYASVQNLLWFHAAAVPAAALEDVRPIYFALMKLIGGSTIGLGLLGAFVALFPLRRGVPFAGTLLAAAYALPLVAAALVAEGLRVQTMAPTSWHIMGVLLAVDAAAYVAHIAAGKAAPK